MNQAILSGNLGEKLELNQTKGGCPFVRFNLAVRREFNSATTDWIPCRAWRETAKYLATHTQKGSGITVRGEIRKESFRDRDGKEREITYVNVERAEITRGYVDTLGGQEAAQKENDAYAQNFGAMEEVPADDDLPF